LHVVARSKNKELIKLFQEKCQNTDFELQNSEGQTPWDLIKLDKDLHEAVKPPPQSDSEIVISDDDLSSLKTPTPNKLLTPKLEPTTEEKKENINIEPLELTPSKVNPEKKLKILEEIEFTPPQNLYFYNNVQQDQGQNYIKYKPIATSMTNFEPL